MTNLNQKTSNKVEDASDSAVVYQETILGLKATQVAGNRTKDPEQEFERYWTKFLSLPPSIIQIALNGSVWVFSASLVLKVVQLTSFGSLLLLPLGALLIGLIVAYAYLPSLRFVIAVRLALLVLGIILVI